GCTRIVTGSVPMDILWIIGKIAVYTFVLNVLLRQTYNFIFFLGRMPIAWICVVALLGLANVFLAFKLSWDPGIVSSAVLFAFLLNWPPPNPRALDSRP
ncbi:MAG TPA: hypothetical protein VFN63_16410, partial [Pseudolabrys sp.]|nr:hypothetical protein [Pseudolabrys sp.]